MNKKLWLGIYLVSATVFYLSLAATAVMGILLFDEIVKPQAVLVIMILVGVVGYVQFLLAHTVTTLMLLYRIWDAVQDGVTQVSPGKAIGFLFIPFYNIYWVFRVWAGYPKDYNEFAARNAPGTPDLPGTFHTLFPVAILLTAVFILPLLVLPIITLFLISRSCDAVNNLSLARAAAAEGRIARPADFIGTPENPRSKTPLFAMGAFAVVAVLFVIGFGTFAWFNLSPTPSAEVLPAKVNTFDLQPGGYSRGSILGMRKDFVDRIYVENGGAKRVIRYNVNLFPSETEPKRLIESICAKEPSAAINDSAGKPVGKYCNSSGSIFLQNGSTYMWLTLPLGSDAGKYKGAAATSSDFVEFAKALPLNKGAVFGELAGGSSSTPANSSSTSTTTTTSTSGDSSSVGKDAAADFTFTGDELYKATNGRSAAELAKYSGKIMQVTARKYSDTSSSVMLQAGKDSFFASYEPSESTSFAQAQKDDRLVIKCAAETQYTFNLKRCVLVENKKIITANDTPDFTYTADEFWNKVASYNLPAGERSKMQDLLRTKIVKVSGTVKGLSGDMANLSAAGTNTISCKPDPENASMFSSLKEGQSVTFLAVFGVVELEHCIVIAK